MKPTHRYFLAILVAFSSVVLLHLIQARDRTHRTEARFLRDYTTVAALAENMATHGPQGFESSFPHLNRVQVDLATMEKSISDSLHFGHGWERDSFRQATYRPAMTQAGAANPPDNAALLLKHYFGDLERSGFTSGKVGFSTTATTDSTEVASKDWYNQDRTLIVHGQIVKNRASGEIIASVSYWGTLNYRPN